MLSSISSDDILENRLDNIPEVLIGRIAVYIVILAIFYQIPGQRLHIGFIKSEDFTIAQDLLGFFKVDVLFIPLFFFLSH